MRLSLRATWAKIPPPARPCVVATCLFLAAVALRWDRETGLTTLLRFGDEFAGRQIPAVQALTVRTYPGVGYDGQFYAQLAVNPNVRDPEVQEALDNPQYRSRRILLSAVVHVLGAGRPWLTLQLFALANVAVWLALGWLLWRRVASLGWHGTGIWLACMLGIGALDSVRMSLTELPAMLLVFIAIEAVERRRTWPAVAALAAAALTRDTTLLAAAGAGTGDLRRPRTWAGHLWTGLLIALPVAAWTYWLTLAVPAGNTLGHGHFTWPGQALGTQVAACLRQLFHGNFDSRYVFGLIAVVSFSWQTIYVLRRATFDPPPWLRMALPFAVFFFFIGDRFWPQLVLGNFCVLHAVYRFLPD